MISWKIREKEFDKNKISYLGNKFLIGNGYMGVRGTLAEYGKENLVAVNLAGIYDKVGDGWREPLNAPNGFYAYLVVDGEVLKLPDNIPEVHYTELDYRYGIVSRHSEWKTSRGTITFDNERFVSMSDVHLGVMKCKVTADFHADVKVVYGIDGDVWDINGPHYDNLEYVEDDIVGIIGTTHEKAYKVAVFAGDKTNFPCEKKIHVEDKKILKDINFITEVDKEYTIERFFGIYTSKDCDDCANAALKEVSLALKNGYEDVICEHKDKWSNLWENSQVIIEGDDQAMEALNYSLYHLHCIAPRHTDRLSITARGLSGQTYKGAVFWDTEMFILDFFLMTEPEVAKSLMKYRIDSLGGAKEKAKEYGLDGAFYAWESQEGGFDACSDYNIVDVFTKRPMRTFFKDKQVHISAAVVYGIGRYLKTTGDTSILSEGGAHTIIECARFYYSLLLKRAVRPYYEIHDVVGPDEYHERVNNNGYTNRMAKYTFEQAINVINLKEQLSKEERDILDSYNLDELKDKFVDAAENIYLPEANEDGVIPQFDGYFNLEDASIDEVRSRLLDPKEYWGGAYGVASDTQVIKQADVVTWLNMFSDEFDLETKLKNLEYYETRTEHGSSLSACMYALLACKCNRPDKAYDFFMKSASADIKQGAKEWAGLVYIGGTHPAAAGGAYMVALQGFGGLSFEGDKINIKPNLPENWNRLCFRVHYKEKLYEIDINGSEVTKKELS